MATKIPTPWERIEEVMTHVRATTVRDFGDRIGLTRSETLYQIKRGNNNISKKMAERIVAAFPDIDEAFLLTGHRSHSQCRIPFYILEPVRRYRDHLPPDNFLSMPLEGVPPLSFATVNNEPEPVLGVMQHSVIMVEETTREGFAAGKPHLVETDGSLVVRYVGDDARSEHYRLWSDNSSIRAQVISAEEIRSLFVLRYILNIY